MTTAKVNFGFSAYLKILCLNERPQRRALRERLEPSENEGGYDFHRSLKLHAAKLLRGEARAEIEASVARITRAPERRSVVSGLESLTQWRSENPGAIFEVPSAVYEDRSGEFTVKFIPDFGMDVGGKRTAIHIWNTKKPDLIRNIVHGALYTSSTAYAGTGAPPEDLAVLSLRNGMLYRLSEAREAERMGEGLATAVGIELRRVRTELGIPGGSDRREPPPPPTPPV